MTNYPAPKDFDSFNVYFSLLLDSSTIRPLDQFYTIFFCFEKFNYLKQFPVGCFCFVFCYSVNLSLDLSLKLSSNLIL